MLEWSNKQTNIVLKGSLLTVTVCIFGSNHIGKTCIIVHSNLMLSPWFYGPYKIIERNGLVVYRLELPSGSKSRLVFHTSCLRRKIGSVDVVISQLSNLKDGILKIQLVKIPDCRPEKYCNHAITKVLVQWAHLPFEDATWKDWHKLKKSFQNSNLKKTRLFLRVRSVKNPTLAIKIN